jgi:hypothetical protein
MLLVKRLGTRFLVDAANRTPLPAAVVCRGTTCVPQKKTRRAGHDVAGKLGVSVMKRGEPTTDSLVRLKPILRCSG